MEVLRQDKKAKISYLDLLRLMEGGVYPPNIMLYLCNQIGYYYWDAENSSYLLNKSDKRNNEINRTMFNLYLNECLTDAEFLEKNISIIDYI